MYLSEERQIKASGRPGVLPSAPRRRGRLGYRTLTLGLPLTAGLVWARWGGGGLGERAHWDPLALFSVLMWMVYASILAGRVVGRWHGRRAAYLAVAGFCALLLTLGAGILLQGRHGS